MRKKGTLSRILTIRDNRKREIELKIKKIQDRIDEENARLDKYQRMYEESRELFENNVRNCNASRIAHYYDFFFRIYDKIEEQIQKSNVLQSKLNILKEELIDAYKDKKAIELLKEKETKVEKYKQKVSYQKQADFFALLRRKNG